MIGLTGNVLRHVMFIFLCFALIPFHLGSCIKCKRSEQVALISQITEPVMHGEGPHWSEEEEALYFVDISGHALHRYHPITKRHTHLQLNDTVNVAVPVKDKPGLFVLGYGRKIVLLNWDRETDDHNISVEFTVDGDKPRNRFNDGKADSKGNLWIGTMDEEDAAGKIVPNRGSLFKVSSNCKISNVLSPVTISNGITWNRDNNLMYYIDTPTRRVDVFDFDVDKGSISNRRPFFDFAQNDVNGFPDGMTIDRDGHLWVACWNGSQVIRISPEGELVKSIMLPAERVTSVTWGGKDLSTLFVTTMYKGLTAEQRMKQPNAGAVFAVSGLGTGGSCGGNSASQCYITSIN